MLQSLVTWPLRAVNFRHQVNNEFLKLTWSSFFVMVFVASSWGETEAGVPIQEGTGGQAAHNRGEETQAEGRTGGWDGMITGFHFPLAFYMSDCWCKCSYHKSCCNMFCIDRRQLPPSNWGTQRCSAAAETTGVRWWRGRRQVLAHSTISRACQMLFLLSLTISWLLCRRQLTHGWWV